MKQAAIKRLLGERGLLLRANRPHPRVNTETLRLRNLHAAKYPWVVVKAGVHEKCVSRSNWEVVSEHTDLADVVRAHRLQDIRRLVTVRSRGRKPMDTPET